MSSTQEVLLSPFSLPPVLPTSGRRLERTTSFIVHRSFSTTGSTTGSLDYTSFSQNDTPEPGAKRRLVSREKEMARNLQSAIRAHGFSPSQLPLDEPHFNALRAAFLLCISENQGIRRSMEDASTAFSTDEGEFVALFDGHGDKSGYGEIIAKMAADFFRKDFPALVKQHYPNVGAAFKEFCETVHSKIPSVIGGTTALISFTDLTNCIYLGNIGDSKGVAFRMKNGKIHAIPLSPILNWKTPTEAARAKAIFGEEKFKKWNQTPEAKAMYFPGERLDPQICKVLGINPLQPLGVNVTRSLGDPLMAIEGETALSHESIDTMFQLELDDLLVFGCDGLWDVPAALSDKDRILKLIEDVIEPKWGDPALADKIAEWALTTAKSSDNVTVITALVKTKAYVLKAQHPEAPKEEESLTQPYEQ